jgi:DNA-binding beta-propeller fold protein YncE
MRTAILAALVAITVASCGSVTTPPPTTSAPPPPTPTSTGILPPGVPTEGDRPPADALAPAAEPQQAPPQDANVPGRVLPVGAAPEGIAVDAATRIVAVAKRNPTEVLLFNADSGAMVGRTGVPGFARHLQLAAPGGPVLVPVESINALIRIELSTGAAEPLILTGTAPHDATQAADGTVFVANEMGGTVAVVRGDAVVKVFTDSVQPAGLAAVGNRVGLIDVRKNDLTIYDAAALTIVGSTPAGRGPTHLVADKHGRMIAADTRGDAVRVFEPTPTPHEVGMVAQRGGPYGMAYDETRDRLWVTSSGTNEVVGYDMSGPTPQERQRLSTVQNPYTVGVDSTTGRLFIASASGGLLQIVDPAT